MSPKKSNPYNIFLDDLRLPQTTIWMKYPPKIKWKVARNYDHFISIIKEQGYAPTVVSIDHDLSPEHYIDGTVTEINYDNYQEKTGFHAITWLIEYCKQNFLPLPEYYVHSFNDIGKMNIILAAERYKKAYDATLKK